MDAAGPEREGKAVKNLWVFMAVVLVVLAASRFGGAQPVQPQQITVHMAQPREKGAPVYLKVWQGADGAFCVAPVAAEDGQ